MMIPCDNRKRVSATRDFPFGCGTRSNKIQSVGVGFILAATRYFPPGSGTNQGIRNGSEVVSATKETRQDLTCSEDNDGCGTSVAHRNYHSSREDESLDCRKETTPNRIGCQGCVSAAHRNYSRPKEDESFDVIMKKAGFDLAPNTNVGSGRFVSTKRKFTSTFGSKVKPLSSEEAIKLMPSHGSRRPLSYSSANIHKKPWPLYNQKHSLKTKNMSNAASLKAKTHRPTQHREGRFIPAVQQNKIAKVLTPREKVLEVLRLFNLQFEALDRDKAARRGHSKTATSRIDYLTRSILVKNRVQVNNKKMIGPVPGIEVGDEFQFKSQLNLIGLHFDIRGGIDYINEGDLKLATSIVESEGNGYGDRSISDVIIYTGQGGNVTSNDLKEIEDQKLVTGNLALANSMRAKNPVRVIRGRKRLDQRGKRYVYDGLYLVVDYWRERGPGGNRLFKFKLCRVSGQPSVDLRY